MYLEQLNSIMLEEYSALDELFKSLCEQFNYITKKNIFALDAVREKIENCARSVAKCEVERRKLVNGKSMTALILESDNEVLKENFENIQNLIHKLNLQKGTNEVLIRQGLNYTTQMLNVLNPNRKPRTYNSYGRRK